MIYINLDAWWTVSLDVLLQKLFAIKVPTLSQIEGECKGKNVIITGPTSGIGQATATELARRGANITLACRNISKGERLKNQIIKNGCLGEINTMQLDTSDLDSVRNFVSFWESSGKKIDILINNAGIFNATSGRQEINGVEAHMITNHLGHFLLTLKLLPFLQKQGGRVVNVSSIMCVFSRISVQDPELQKGFDTRTVYGNSKMAQLLTTNTLHKKFNKFGIDFFAVHPGNVYTNVTQTWGWFYNAGYKVMRWLLLFSAEEGARSSLTCAISPSVAGKSSYFFGSNCEVLQKWIPRWYPNNGWGNDWDMLEEWMWHWSLEKVQLDESSVRKLVNEFEQSLSS